MTGPASGASPEDGRGDPHIVLDDDGLDVLELALSGALPVPPLVEPPDAPVLVLTDAENTPLARMRLDESHGSDLEPLRPLPHGFGPHWDPDVRREPAAVREHLRALVGTGRVVAIVIDDLPTTADLEAIAVRGGHGDAAAIVCAIPVARRAHPAGEVGSAGITRAGIASADVLAADLPGVPVVPVAVPWPGPGGTPPGPGTTGRFDTTGLRLDAILAAYGATDVWSVRERRSPEERAQLAALPGVFEEAVRRRYPPASAREVLRARRGLRPRGAVVLFTGLSGSGKSTIARALAAELEDAGPRGVTLLDGDEVRQHLSSELGFDDRSRELNVARIAYVASLVAAHGGIAIAAPIAPFASGRARARALAEPHGTFVLVHVSTPLEVCEARDRKGLYARARAGLIPDFTGISSPYEAPLDADVTVDTTDVGVADAVRQVRAALAHRLGETDDGGD